MNGQLKRWIQNIQTPKTELFFQILLVFIVPIFLLDMDLVSIQTRVPGLSILVTVLLVILFRERWSYHMLGLGLKNIKHYFIPYFVFTLCAVVFIVLFGTEINGSDRLSHWWTYDHFVYLFVIVSIFQEIAYRGFLIPALGKLTDNWIYALLVNATIFTYLHVIFPQPFINLPVAFVGGLGFAYMYTKYPSLYLVILSHTILNFFAVLYGFFVIPGITF